MGRQRDRRFNRLTPQAIKYAKPGSRLHDGQGLYLETSKKGRHAQSWILRYMIGRKAHSMGLGSLADFSLAEARARARQARQLLADGVDPLEERRKGHLQKALAAAKSVTLATAAEQYITSQEPRWKRPSQAADWRRLFKLHTVAINHLPTSAIDTALVVEVLTPIWNTQPVLARRLRQALEAVLDAARVKGQRSGENPARWKGHLDKVFVAPSKLKPVKHHVAVAVADLPGIMARLRERPSVGAAALRFLTLTAVRREQVLAMRWGEVDLVSKIWTSPPENTKGEKGSARPHRVPLADAAIAILTAQPVAAGPVFKISRTAMAKVLRQLHPTATPHGMRSAFKDFARQHPFPDELSELALHHVVGDRTRQAYARDDMVEARRPLMELWSAHCTGMPAAKVVTLKPKRRWR